MHEHVSMLTMLISAVWPSCRMTRVTGRITGTITGEEDRPAGSLYRAKTYTQMLEQQQVDPSASSLPTLFELLQEGGAKTIREKWVSSPVLL